MVKYRIKGKVRLHSIENVFKMKSKLTCNEQKEKLWKIHLL